MMILFKRYVNWKNWTSKLVSVNWMLNICRYVSTIIWDRSSWISKSPTLVSRGSKAYRECQLKLLRQELSNKKSHQRIKDNEQRQLKDELIRTLSLVDYTHLISIFASSNDIVLSKCQQRQKKKLYDLGYFERDKDVNDPHQVIHNHSSYAL